jgi:hypothetical protein
LLQEFSGLKRIKSIGEHLLVRGVSESLKKTNGRCHRGDATPSVLSSLPYPLWRSLWITDGRGDFRRRSSGVITPRKAYLHYFFFAVFFEAFFFFEALAAFRFLAMSVTSFLGINTTR